MPQHGHDTDPRGVQIFHQAGDEKPMDIGGMTEEQPQEEPIWHSY